MDHLRHALLPDPGCRSRLFDTNVSGGLAGFGYGATTSAQQVTSGPTNCGKSSIDRQCFPDSMFNDPVAFPLQSRNQFRGPGYFNTDLSVMKNFRFPK